MILHGLANIPEVALHGRADVDAPQGSPQALSQLHGVVPGAVGGTETGHGDGDDIAGRTLQQPHGDPGDQDRQGAVQPAGESHHGGLGPGVLQPLLQPQCGDAQDLAAAAGPVTGVLREKRRGGDITGQRCGGRLQRKPDGHEPPLPRAGERGHPPPLAAELIHVDLADRQAGGKAPLVQQRAVFRDQIMPGEDQVGGGLALPRVGIDIAAHQPGGLPGHQGTPVGVLSHRLVAGGQVQQQGGARPRQRLGGRLRRPQVLADLHPQDKPRHAFTGEDHIGAEKDLLTAEGKQPVRGPAGLKPASFVELSVVGQVRLGDDCQDLAPVDHRGAVIELALVPHRQAQGCDHIQVFGGLQNGGQPLLRTPQQGVLQEQIGAGIPRQAQLGQRQHPHPLPGGPPHQGKDLLGVKTAVGYPNFGRTCRHLNKSIAHRQRLLIERIPAFATGL